MKNTQNDAEEIYDNPNPREGWFKVLLKEGAGEEELLLDDIPNDFDEDEWTW